MPAGTDGPLSRDALAAVLRAAASLCNATEGRGHDVLTALDTVRDRVLCGTGFPELAGYELGPRTGVQVAAALGQAIFGRVPAEPVGAVLRWQESIARDSAVMLGQMFTTAAGQVEAEAAIESAKASLQRTAVVPASQ